MASLNHQIHIRSTYTRSINLQRDSDNLELIQAYVLTSKAIQALERIAEGFTSVAHERSLALIGPYGSGKSAFALFLSVLLNAGKCAAHRVALTKLQISAPHLFPVFQKTLVGRRGFLRVVINGIPTSLKQQVMSALALAVEREKINPRLVAKIRAAVLADAAMDKLILLFGDVQNAWALIGGSGVLLEIDELGKFLEYESYHPQHSEIHLLQLLAEHAQQAHAAPLHLVVMLHQAFEEYTNRVGKHLRDEWQKVQGRFSAIAFLEPAEQALRVVSAAFDSNHVLLPATRTAVDVITETLVREGALAYGLKANQARKLFKSCYPLHPLTTLILPVLCQKVAQNERTMFSYLSSKEPFGLCLRLEQITSGDWIEPSELYDYFIHNQMGGFSDPLTYHRWMEVITALERFDAEPSDAAVRLLKTIGVLNLIGAQRGLKASPALLKCLFSDKFDELITRLEQASVIHYRSYSQEYRVWQGTDFDLSGALRAVVAEFSSLPLVQTLNQLALMKPIVARRASIVTGSLRCFIPRFIDQHTRSDDVEGDGKTGLRLWFYLAESDEQQPNLADLSEFDVVAVCQFTERLRESVINTMALRELPKRHATLHNDPVAQREHRAWLANAEAETEQLFRTLLNEPNQLCWFWGRNEARVLNRRDLQEHLSDWAQEHCFSKSPHLRNELINWDSPSPSANTGRKRLLVAMLSAADQVNLGIEKTPAEMSLYLSLLKASHLHRQENGRWGFHAPDKEDPCRLKEVWHAIMRLLGNSGGRQVQISAIYQHLRSAPFGVKLGVLPVLIVAYLLAHRREVALYQEGSFCDTLTMDQAELLCRRPELFAIERFDMAGLRGNLFNRYISSVVGEVREDASLLDIVRPLVQFISNLPLYTRQCKGLSKEAMQVRDAFSNAKSPGVLLFEALPQACGLAHGAFSSNDPSIVEQFIDHLVRVLRELKDAYALMLKGWQSALNLSLLDEEIPQLSLLRQTLARRYLDLERYTPDRMGAGALICRLGETSHSSDQAWLESLGTLLGRVPPHKWREENRLQAELRLHEMAEKLRELEQLRLAVPGHLNSANGTLLVKMVDAERGEFSRVIQVSSAQRAVAVTNADKVAKSLVGLDEAAQLAVVAILLERLSKTVSKL